MMVTEQTIKLAEAAAQRLRQDGEGESARAVEALIEAARPDALPTLNVLTSTEAGDLLGVTGQTIKNWVRQGRLTGYRVGSRIMVPREAVEEYVCRALRSLDLDVVSDDEAARIVAEGRQKR